MLQTMLGMPDATRKNGIALLGNLVADGVQLTQFARQAHWNTKGPSFIALHELFDKVHEDMERSVDLFAERIAQFGGTVDGTCKTVAKLTSLSDYPPEILDEHDHLLVLAAAVAEFGDSVRDGIEKVASWRDPGTADILTEVSRMLDKTLWILESHTSRSDESRAEKGGKAQERASRAKERDGSHAPM